MQSQFPTSIRPRRICIASSPESIRYVQNIIVDQLLERGYCSRQVFAIRLALEEALVNAVRHGNANNLTKCVEVSYLVSSFGTWIRVEDEGHGFDS